MKRIIYVVAIAAVLVGTFTRASAHCEIPCGIYGDEMRIALLEEHIETIEKSMKMITDLSADEPKNFNQIVRWVNNKEKHANDFQVIVTQYFMTQRIPIISDQSSAKYEDYVHKISLLHEMLIYAMKSKQTTDLALPQKLGELVTKFEIAYFGEQSDHHH